MLENIIQIVQSLGFPVAVAAACAFYVKYRDDRADSKIEKIQDSFIAALNTERLEHKEETSKMTEAINNNTAIMQKLYDKLTED